MPLIDQLLAEQAALPDRLKALLPRDIDGLNIRHHGDFHLGQMLIVKDDIFIIDFEGEPRRTIAERRRKAPAARDVAGLIRSIDYSVTAALDRALKVAHDEHGRRALALADWRDQATAAFLGSLSRDHGETSGYGRPILMRRTGCSTSSCLRRPSTRSSTSWRTGPTGCACR